MAASTWDERLITRERALELVGRWPVVLVVSFSEGEAVHVHCAAPPRAGERKACYQSCARLLTGYRTNVEELLAGVLRHAVLAHELDTGTRPA